MSDGPLRHRWLVGLVGVGLVALAVGVVRSRVAAYRALPAQAEAMTAEALRAAPGPRWVVLTDARWGEPRVRQADGLSVPILDAQGRLVALGLVREGDERALDDAPWGIAEPLDAPGYLERLAERGLDARGVVGLEHLRVGARPDDHLLEAAAAVGVALLGAVALALALLPSRWARAAAARTTPTARARLAGLALLGAGGLVFAMMCHAPPTGLHRLLAPTFVAAAAWGGVALLVAPRRVRAG